MKKMSRLIVDKLPKDCNECPLFGHLLIDNHVEWRQCPMRDYHPNCLDRFLAMPEGLIKRLPYYVEFIDPYGVLDGIQIDAYNEEEAREKFRRWRRDGQIKDIYVLEEEEV